ncbi:hypothetical protein SOCEGT47_060040 [Sorangium cellulosum]|uniref:Sodium:proton antiporter n=1 Tax=Sorangium cellulosum TaxID=56 RepID=A0A4P2Q7G3_SORCE|nr:hydrogenase subunit MbhD domain-containing protein [Sorangium cellulosum]AUX25457.1 hypothetical protein SOCEGT47_060040 [Sorangium cellulosum]
MSAVDRAVDVILAMVLPFLAWRALRAVDLAKTVVLFIAFGLLSAMAWARLGAPDIALVEAAVGSGITGALVMSALGWVGPARPPPRPPSWRVRVLLALLLCGLVLLVGAVVFSLPDPSRGLRDDVLAHLGPSGVSHPVTAVLLNFRGHDTLLEIIVLLVAVLGAQSQVRSAEERDRVAPMKPLLPVLVRQLFPGIVLVAGYLLWKGAHAPGGAFQAGAILGGGAILLMLAGTVPPPPLSSPVVRIALLVGPTVFLAVATAPLFAGRHLLEYPPEHAGLLILCVESALAISIAAILAMFFPAAAPAGRSGERAREEGRS